MEFNSTEAVVDKSKKSKFNAGVLKMQRIHDLLQQINLANLNLLAYNEGLGTYNYHMKFHSCNGIFHETESKLNKTKTAEGERQRLIIESLLKRFPPNKTFKDRVWPYKERGAFVSKNWDMLEPELHKYESLIRDFLDETGMDSPESALIEEAGYS